MIERKQPILDADEVLSRLEAVRREGYQEDQVIKLLEQSVMYGPQPQAELVVRELVPQLSDEKLSDLTTKYLLPEMPGGLSWDIDLTSAPHFLIEQLVPRGFAINESADVGWTITLPDGDRFSCQFWDTGTMTLASINLPGRGEAFCRTALLAGLVHILRSAPPSTELPAL